MTMDWQAPPGSPSSYIVKKILRLEIPVDSYPNVGYVLLTTLFFEDILFHFNVMFLNKIWSFWSSLYRD